MLPASLQVGTARLDASHQVRSSKTRGTESSRVNTTRRHMRNICTVFTKNGINLRSAKCGMLTKYSFRHKARVLTGGLLIAAGIAAVIIVLIYLPVKIEGNSMTPLLSDHEAIVINRVVYHFEPIHRGDIVVFRYPLDATQSFIKRIVGLPGETVQIRQGFVYVNGNWVPEPYVPSQYKDLSDFGPIQVPSGSYFVLGDRRNSSNDSRVFGTVAGRLIEGRAAFAYWPIDHFGWLSNMGTTEAKAK
jgi:signal peptidase I